MEGRAQVKKELLLTAGACSQRALFASLVFSEPSAMMARC